MNIETLLDRAKQGDASAKGELRARAQNGETDALWALGVMYETGQGLPQKLDKAAECYNRAADQGHAKARQAMAKIALWVMGGMGAEDQGGMRKPDMAECIREAMENLDQGYAKAQQVEARMAGGDGEPQQGATNPERDKVFALLNTAETPTQPALWISTDAGETWVWGDFFMMLQKEPVTVKENLCKEAGLPTPDMGLFYPYVMTALYRLDRNPHGPSFRPVAVATLEQSDQDSFRDFMAALGAKTSSSGGGKWGPPFLCMFTPDRHLNYGRYQGDIDDRETVRAHFFAMLGEYLGLDGQPRMIGTMAQAPGHPETGLPL